jgi:hypothetical protein
MKSDENLMQIEIDNILKAVLSSIFPVYLKMTDGRPSE